MKKYTLFAAAAAICLALTSASAQTINFDEGNVSEGSVLSAQYPGLTFLGSPLVGSSAAWYTLGGTTPFGTWATNTDMTITATDIGTQAAGQNLILHAIGNTYPGWSAENGDPVFSISFGFNISSITVTFSGIFTGDLDVGIADFTGGVIGATAKTPGTGGEAALQSATLNFGGGGVNQILVVPGSFNDWVSVTSISYTVVPEPQSAILAVLAGGAILFAFRRRSIKR
jgi:hypothetical protein